MAKQVWEYVQPTWHGCDLCTEGVGDYFGSCVKAQAVVWLCTDCADALADVVNERRAEQREAMDELLQDSVDMGVYD